MVAPVESISHAAASSVYGTAEPSGESSPAAFTGLRAGGASQEDEAAFKDDAEYEDDAATIVNPSPARSVKPKRRRFPLALVFGSLALAVLLGLLLYSLRKPDGNDAATANSNNAPTPAAPTPGVQPDATPASQAAIPNPSPQPTVAQPATVAAERESIALRSAIDNWLAAHNSRNLTQVTNFYMPKVTAFYLEQNTTRAAVRAEKARLFKEPRLSIQRTGDPQITFRQDGDTATTIFRKSYSRGETSQSQSGEVLQEIIWQKTNRGWKIISERDIRVLR
jgi:ketosteroid isomerase-like protein